MKLFFRTYGTTGKTVILLHGMLGMSDNLVPFARKLSKRFKVFVPDLRNHGNSPHSKNHSYRNMSEDIYKFSETHNIANAIIIGHSMGGKVAMQYAEDYPERVSKLIVMDIAPRQYSANEFEQEGKTNHSELLSLLMNLDLSIFKSRTEIYKHLIITFDNSTFKFLLQKNIKRNKNNFFELKFNSKTLYSQLYEIAASPSFATERFKNDTLFIKAEKSDYLKTSDYQEIRRIYPNSKIEIINDSGHIIHLDQLQKLFERIMSFLKQKI